MKQMMDTLRNQCPLTVMADMMDTAVEKDIRSAFAAKLPFENSSGKQNHVEGLLQMAADLYHFGFQGECKGIGKRYALIFIRN
ncbi:MAG: hypothetical protein MJA29_10935, partial [Candidatus Omnitrophica bacterium]|nr:hypothetical protein [Candidatus Omnitrophota bacterium]